MLLSFGPSTRAYIIVYLVYTYLLDSLGIGQAQIIQSFGVPIVASPW